MQCFSVALRGSTKWCPVLRRGSSSCRGSSRASHREAAASAAASSSAAAPSGAASSVAKVAMARPSEVKQTTEVEVDTVD